MLRQKVQTLFALGSGNLARVGGYRLGLRLGIHPVQRITGVPAQGPFLVDRAPARRGAVATSRWQGDAEYFSFHRFPIPPAGRPDWLANPFRTDARARADQPWWRIPDFDAHLGDIKTVWEASRFDWLIAMAQRASLGDKVELERLNSWLSDWCAANPPYLGPNWKCGQEASIRVLHLMLAAAIIGDIDAPASSFRTLISQHARRIAPTISYAVGQQNNHATSEAAALFIGGGWLAKLGDPEGEKWSRLGRRWLENRALALIEPDGTFSQYSVVYHRLMLDTYCLAEIWRRRLGAPAFAAQVMSRLEAATLWLQQLTCPLSGDAPNLGANDGARLMPLTAADFRDFRPTLQLAANLFCNKRALAQQGDWDQPAIWLDVPPAVELMSPPRSVSLDQGGLHVLRQGPATAYLRYPRFRFRPSHADALHLDLWINGRNVIRDGGTFSYSEDPRAAVHFGGTIAHSTVEFDGRDQMPRLGRFLFGAWLRAEDVQAASSGSSGVTAAAGYCDYRGCRHHRSVVLEQDRLVCTDRLLGGGHDAVLRWRLEPGPWTIHGSSITDGRVRLTVNAEGSSVTARIITDWESRYYLSKTSLPVFEVTCRTPACLVTEITY